MAFHWITTEENYWRLIDRWEDEVAPLLKEKEWQPLYQALEWADYFDDIFDEGTEEYQAAEKLTETVLGEFGSWEKLEEFFDMLENIAERNVGLLLQYYDNGQLKNWIKGLIDLEETISPAEKAIYDQYEQKALKWASVQEEVLELERMEKFGEQECERIIECLLYSDGTVQVLTDDEIMEIKKTNILPQGTQLVWRDGWKLNPPEIDQNGRKIYYQLTPTEEPEQLYYTLDELADIYREKGTVHTFLEAEGLDVFVKNYAQERFENENKRQDEQYGTLGWSPYFEENDVFWGMC